MATKMDDINGNEFKFYIYPNPANDKVYMSFNKIIQDGKLTIYDITGMAVIKKSIICTNSLSFDIVSIQSGTYFIAVEEDGIGIYKQLMIAK
jgi:hypothetical protein